MKQSSIYLFFITTIILASCGTPPTAQIPGSSFQSSQIKEPQIGAPYTEITIQEIRASNCDGTNPTTTISRSLVQEQTTFFEVAVEAGGLIRGTPIPTVLEAELEAKIKTALGSNLGNKFEQTISTVLETQSGQAWKHKIYWNETKVKGIIDVVYQNGTATLNFEKMIAIELFDRTGEALICDGNGVSILPTSTGSQEIPVATLETKPPTIQNEGPFREHELVAVGTGIFTQVTSSDGNASYSQSELDTSHYRIYRIRPEENPNGCGVSIYNTNKVWFSSSVNTVFTVNGQEAGKLSVSTGRHGFVADWDIKVGDNVCAVGYASSGFHIIFGPDMYYHYDSYCNRGYC